jgi:hypothetical protein
MKLYTASPTSVSLQRPSVDIVPLAIQSPHKIIAAARLGVAILPPIHAGITFFVAVVCAFEAGRVGRSRVARDATVFLFKVRVSIWIRKMRQIHQSQGGTIGWGKKGSWGITSGGQLPE